MFVTISICSRNRALSLARTLASIEAAKRPACDWELLITDNGSTDTTGEVVQSFAGRLPVRLQIEAKPGVAHARNAAAAAAAGHYILGTDDDTVVDANWFCAYVDAFTTWPAADLFAGRIVPVLESPATTWFEQAVSQIPALLAVRDMGNEPLALSDHSNHTPYGANCAVRTEVQRQFPFDPRRGPGALYFGEETASFKAILAAGHAGRWVPGSIVEHMISPKRQTRDYIRWWYQSLGRTVVWEGQETHEGRQLFGAPLWLWRRALTGELAFRVAHMTKAPDTWVGQLVQASLDRGRLQYLLSTVDRQTNRRFSIGKSGHSPSGFSPLSKQ